MNTCTRCEYVPRPQREGVLYLAPPRTHDVRKLPDYLQKVHGLEVTEPYPDIYRVTVDAPTLQALCADQFGKLTDLELEDARCLLKADPKAPTVHDLIQMQSLKALVASVEGQWFHDMLRSKQLRAHFQPIVEAAAPEKIMAYECLCRGMDANGAIRYPGEMFAIAKDADLMFQLDRAARLAAIHSAAAHAIQQNIFINFIPAAIYDPGYCLRTTVAAIEETQLKKEQLVFEVVESEEIHDKAHLLKILDYYRSHGFRVALDDLGAGYSSLNLLHQLRPDFIKLDRDMVQQVDQDPYKAQISSMLLSLAQELGIQTIAEGIETPGEWRWLQEHGVDFVQGYLFARPAEAPPTQTAPSTA